MRIRSKAFSVAWKLFIVIVGGLTLLDQVGLFSGKFNVVFFHYFTNWSALILVVYLIVDLIAMLIGKKKGEGMRVTASRPIFPGVKHAITLAILVTGLIGHFMLGYKLFEGGFLHYELVVLHYIIPIMFLLDWLLFDEKGSMTPVGPLGWCSIPLAYVVLAIAEVQLVGFGLGTEWRDACANETAVIGEVCRYPYPFLDLDALGVGGVALYIVGLLVAFVILGYILMAIDRLMSKRALKKHRS